MDRLRQDGHPGKFLPLLGPVVFRACAENLKKKKKSALQTTAYKLGPDLSAHARSLLGGFFVCERISITEQTLFDQRSLFTPANSNSPILLPLGKQA